jgi:hypothetical protein
MRYTCRLAEDWNTKILYDSRERMPAFLPAASQNKRYRTTESVHLLLRIHIPIDHVLLFPAEFK